METLKLGGLHKHNGTGPSPCVCARSPTPLHSLRSHYSLHAAMQAGSTLERTHHSSTIFEVRWGRGWKLTDLCFKTWFFWHTALLPSVTPTLCWFMLHVFKSHSSKPDSLIQPEILCSCSLCFPLSLPSHWSQLRVQVLWCSGPLVPHFAPLCRRSGRASQQRTRWGAVFILSPHPLFSFNFKLKLRFCVFFAETRTEKTEALQNMSLKHSPCCHAHWNKNNNNNKKWQNHKETQLAGSLQTVWLKHWAPAIEIHYVGAENRTRTLCRPLQCLHSLHRNSSGVIFKINK